MSGKNCVDLQISQSCTEIVLRKITIFWRDYLTIPKKLLNTSLISQQTWLDITEQWLHTLESFFQYQYHEKCSLVNYEIFFSKPGLM